MNIKNFIKEKIDKAVMELTGLEAGEYKVGFGDNLEHGDLFASVALVLYSKVKDKYNSPRELASQIIERLVEDSEVKDTFSDIKSEGPGFINFCLTDRIFADFINKIYTDIDSPLKIAEQPKKLMIEFAHPNTHKQFHLGHLRTLLIGGALSNILKVTGNEVFKANYQGDIGPHVAKAVYGIIKLLKEKSLSLENVDVKTPFEKAKFLQEAYITGNRDYEEHKIEIDKINVLLYSLFNSHPDPETRSGVSGSSVTTGSRNPSASSTLSETNVLRASEFGMTESNNGSNNLEEVYKTTRRWSLEYFDAIYKTFGISFDQLFFETEVAECGKKLVLENVDKVFVNDNGTIIFPGEKYGLHNRVFITRDGYPTYEGKEMCLAYKQFEMFPFDRNIHVVAAEQKEYFRVVIKALETLDPKFKNRQFHLSMGMVKLTTGKMSSRTGDIVSIEELLEMLKREVRKLAGEGRIQEDEKENTVEKITKAAIIYSYLKVNPTIDFTFDIEKSISLDGDSGPYLLYTYARIRSVIQNSKVKSQNLKFDIGNLNLDIATEKDLLLARWLYRFPDAVNQAAETLSPSVLVNYLYDLAKEFNAYYQEVSILKAESEDLVQLRLSLISAVAEVIKKGLNLLNIEVVERM